ncbi:MAG: ferrous iron transport protein A [Anaerolineae bacterium]|nr:ferrous iron transport protein A [Anaerolineae bacterium]
MIVSHPNAHKDRSNMTLDQLKPDLTATVTHLTTTGANRRRLMDLGLLPGTRVEVEMISPLGDPVAYRVRGAVIALRRKQAREIEIAVAQEEKTHAD